ncbi:hypothetical protein [Thalassospira sp.]|uniref:hypothetical protein n=1 Tax=Thalassospira sp. TaxID=1912094 RepID=UPI0032EFD918
MLKRSANPAVSLIFSATLLALPFNLQAAETKQIARSSKLGVELFGVGGDAWCKTDTQLQLSRTNESPLVGTEETLFPKIAKIFDTECPEMETAEVVVNDASGATTRGFRISKETGWTIVPDDPAKTAKAETTESTNQTPTVQADVPDTAAPIPAPAKENRAPKKKQPEPIPAVAQEKAIPLTKDSVFWLAAHYGSEALNDDRVIDQLATMGSCDRYLSVRSNEFALRDWRKEVKPDVLSRAKTTPNFFEFSHKLRVDRNYDFDTAMLDIGNFTPRTQRYKSECSWHDDFRDNEFGGEVYVSFEDLPDTFNRKIYLPDALGRAAVDRLEATRNEVRVTYRARLKDVGLITNWPKHYELKAEFVDVKIHTGKQFDYLLVHHDAAKFSAAREQHRIALQKAEQEQQKAEKERLAAQRAHEQELRRLQSEQANMQAQRLFESLAGDNAVPAKLAALHHDGHPSFDNPYDIAANAFSLERKLPVRTFVRVGSRDSIGYRAEWPSRVYLTGAELEEDEWYFVSGMGDGQKIDNALLSIITVEKATKCDDRICMGEADVIDYVRSQYPQWPGRKE